MSTEQHEVLGNLETHHTTPYKPTIRQHPSIDTLSLEQQQELYHREEIIKALLAMRRKYGTIPRGERRAAATELKKGWRMIHEYMKYYVEYAEAYPDEP